MSEENNKPENVKEKVHLATNRQMESYLQISAIAGAVIIAAILILLVYYIRQILGVFVLSFLLSYIVSPLVKMLEKRGLNRTLTVGLLYLVFIGIIVVSSLVFIPMLWNELINLQFSIQDSLSDPELGKNITSSIEDIQNQLSESIPMLENVDLKSQFDISKSIGGIASWILSYIGQTVGTITGYGVRMVLVILSIFIIPFITFFLLKDGGMIKRFILHLIPPKYYDTSMDLLHNIDQKIGRFIRGKFAESLLLSILTSIGLKIMGIKYALLIGSIAGFANLVPYIGPVGIAIPPILLAIYQYGIVSGIGVAIFLSILQFIDNMILVPFIVGKSVDLHPLVTIFVVFVGGKTFGLLGLVAAVPLASIIISIAQVVYREFRYISSNGDYCD